RVSASTWAAVFFLGMTFLPSITFSLSTFVPVGTTVALKLQGNTNNVNWLAGGWSLSGSVAFAIAGQLSDYMGRKQVVFTGQVLLLIGHLVGATAQGLNQIIAAMVIIGAGTGIVFVIYASISEILPNRWRPFGIASPEFLLCVVGSFGPVMARKLTQSVTWRWVFIIGEITGLIATAGTLIFYKPPSRTFQDRTKIQVLYELDYLGIFLYAAGVTLFLLGLGWPGITYPWKSAAVITPITLGGIFFLCTFVWDFSGRVGRPLFPYRLMSKFPEFTSLLIINFSSGLAHIALANFVPQQIQLVFTSDPTLAGWFNIPAGLGTFIGGFVLGSLAPKFKHFPLQLLIANAIQALGCGLLAIATPNRIPAGLIIQGIANAPFAWTLVLSYTTVGLHVPQRDIGLALGLLGASRYLGGAIGSTLFNTILRARASESIPLRVLAAVERFNLPLSRVDGLIVALSSSNATSLATYPANVVAAGTLAIRWAYSDSLAYVWYASIPFCVIACLACLFVRDPSPYLTNHTAV
ncbi:putative siderophore iron transporter, partial [Talaromyces proteolyticus]